MITLIDTTESWVNSLHVMIFLSLVSAAPAEEFGICLSTGEREAVKTLGEALSHVEM